jgi:hypothetical protein
MGVKNVGLDRHAEAVMTRDPLLDPQPGDSRFDAWCRSISTRLPQKAGWVVLGPARYISDRELRRIVERVWCSRDKAVEVKE